MNADEPVYVKVVSDLCTENVTPQSYDADDFAPRDQCVVAFSGEPFPFPQNVDEVLNSEDKEFWTASMQEEMDSHERMKTWGHLSTYQKVLRQRKRSFYFQSKQSTNLRARQI